ncbi:efflux RND transporter periplasmic adaptor subunit [Actinomadura miaoliensis]|uniref:Peptidoglycan-binding protein n=1 Tax=Actinomadura miaoliensis TaxID=430685 RepID=A0ABP7VC75_9ACTN
MSTTQPVHSAPSGDSEPTPGRTAGLAADPAGQTTEPRLKPRRPRRRRRRRIVAAGAAVAVVGAAGIGYAVSTSGSSGEKNKNWTNTSPTALAAVTQGRLSSRIPVSGTLGYAGSYKIVNKASGTFTKLPKVGQTIKSGQVMYRVDGKPVIFLKGGTPVYRDLKRGLKGADVRALNTALVALGYADRSDLNPKSTYYGWATEDAVEELQDKLGLDETGEVGTDLVVFLPRDQLRVTEVSATNGTKAGSDMTVFSASSTDRQISVDLEASNQGQVKPGDKVTITLPNLKTTQGVVTAVGAVAKKSDEGTLTVGVTIRPLDKKATGTLDKAPVQVSIVTETENSVLSVPVNSLLALAGGGYAVEVVGTGGARTLVPVTLGIFDNEAGKVAVTGNGLTAGQKVVVPAS